MKNKKFTLLKSFLLLFFVFGLTFYSQVAFGACVTDSVTGNCLVDQFGREIQNGESAADFVGPPSSAAGETPWYQGVKDFGGYLLDGTSAFFSGSWGVQNGNGGNGGLTQPGYTGNYANTNYPMTNTGVARTGCEPGFTMVAGVCFPSQTNLPDPPGGINQILANLFSWLMGIFTTLAIVAFVISGIQYVTSAGDEHQIQTAKRNAQWSIVGVLVGLSGFVIIQAVARALSASGMF